jgi:hypothetical protein
MSCPEWLTQLTSESVEGGDLPLDVLLDNSLYYPCCRFDGKPIAACNRDVRLGIFSFVYVDYGVTREELFGEINTRNGHGFAGYHLLASRNVRQEELSDRPFPWSVDREIGGRHEDLVDRNLPDGWVKEFFCVWCILERDEERGDEHGPPRFSLLYLGSEGVATFQRLYLDRKKGPKAVAIIQPGHDLGGNWTNYEEPDGIFGRSVLENPAGPPESVMFGGMAWKTPHLYAHCCWPNYTKELWPEPEQDDATLRLWGRGKHDTEPRPGELLDGAEHVRRGAGGSAEAVLVVLPKTRKSLDEQNRLDTYCQTSRIHCVLLAKQ